MKNIISRLTFRITIPVLIIWLLLGVFLYSAVLKTVSEFYSSNIEDDIKWSSRAVLNIFNEEYDNLVKSGNAQDTTYILINQNRAVVETENFLREYNAFGFIQDSGDGRIIFATDLPATTADLAATINKTGVLTTLQLSNGPHFAYSVDYAPWRWRFFIVRPATSYTAFQSRMDNVYIATGIALALAIMLIVYLIHSSVNIPVNRIISHVRRGEKPDYKGVYEAEYLSDSIRQMMESLETLNRNLEEKIKELVAQSEVRKHLEEQLIHAQKMEAVGTLAGGVAHDFNNMLTAVIGYANILKMKLGGDSPLKIYADDILSVSDKAAKLTHSLLAFSRKQPMSPRPIDLVETIRKVEKLLIRLIGENIEFKTFHKEPELVVMADSGQLEQVLINLATNVRDAMPEGGALTISSERIDLSAPLKYIPEGSYAVISVSDTGKGMDETTAKRIFEPFFTTKELGRGTGLGLSIIYGIIKQHNGEINVYSEPGIGTTFRIYLKLIDARPESTGAKEAGHLESGNETILIAEDNPDVRNLFATILEEHGYTVIAAVDGEDAVAKYIENRERIQLLLFDVVMPKKNGNDAYEEIRKSHGGDVPVLFASGYTADILQNKRLLDMDAHLIYTPVPPNVLISKVQEVIAAFRA